MRLHLTVTKYLPIFVLRKIGVTLLMLRHSVSNELNIFLHKAIFPLPVQSGAVHSDLILAGLRSVLKFSFFPRGIGKSGKA